MIRKGILCAIGVGLLAACGAPPERRTAPDFSTADDTAKAILSPYYCRIGAGTTDSREWHILPSNAHDLASARGRDYHIDNAAANTSASRIPFDDADRVELSTDAGGTHLALVHSDRQGRVKAIAWLTMNTNRLWASGPAVSLMGGTLTPNVGEYFVFRVPDNWESVKPNCRHPNNRTAPSCKTVHIEFFDNNDDPKVLDHKPKLVSGNVEEVNTLDECESTSFQSGDGDGDDGPE